MDIRFYHLSKSPLDKALAKLLEKIIATGKRVVVLMDTSEQLSALNNALWTYSQGSFLAHGTREDGFVEYQPIYLTTELENPNQADVLVTIEGIYIKDFTGFQQCLDLFNGLDTTSLEDARKRWQAYKKMGHNVAYWFQTDTGAWEQKQV